MIPPKFLFPFLFSLFQPRPGRGSSPSETQTSPQILISFSSRYLNAESIEGSQTVQNPSMPFHREDSIFYGKHTDICRVRYRYDFDEVSISFAGQGTGDGRGSAFGMAVATFAMAKRSAAHRLRGLVVRERSKRIPTDSHVRQETKRLT